MTFFINGRGIGHIPRFIKAGSANALELKMLKLQKRLQSYIEYKSIIYNPTDKNWYAWYVVDVVSDEKSKANQKVIDIRDKQTRVVSSV